MQANQHSCVLTHYRSAVSAYLQNNHIDPSMNPRAEKTLLYRIIDDERRAVWQDGLMQCHLHLRFLCTEMIGATLGQGAWSDASHAKNLKQHRQLIEFVENKSACAAKCLSVGEAFEYFNFSQLLTYMLNVKEEAPLACLAMALGLSSTRSLTRMLEHLRLLNEAVLCLTPCEFIRGFDRITEEDTQDYQLPQGWLLPQEDSALTGVCTLLTLMHNVPLFELWRDKLVAIEALWKETKPQLELFA